MRIIGGDIGGTKSLLRCLESTGEISFEGRYDSTEYATFGDLLKEALARAPGTIDAACFAVAGPVHGKGATVTNIGWKIEADALSAAFSIGHVSLINDFHGVALGIPLLGANDLLSLHGGAHEAGAPMAVLGAGTGLGEAIVVADDACRHVLTTEGGHADFAPQDEEQTRLFLHLRERYGHVSWERVLSGKGLVNIFTFLGGEEIDAAEIAERADAGDARAVRAFAIFVDIYGAEAGNMALRVMARGGVYLAGGIAAKNIPRFADGRFAQAFLRKGRFHSLLESIPVDLILNEEVGLMGAVEGARRLV